MNPTTLSPVEQIGIPHSETTIGGTYDCEPTLNDQQVFEFCRKGIWCSKVWSKMRSIIV